MNRTCRQQPHAPCCGITKWRICALGSVYPWITFCTVSWYGSTCWQSHDFELSWLWVQQRPRLQTGLDISASKPWVCCLMHPAQAAQFALAHDQHISWKLCSRVVGRCWRDSQAPRGCHLGSHGSMAQWFPSQVTGHVGGKARCLGNSTQCQVCWFCIHQLGWKSLVCGGNDDLPDYQSKLCQLCVKSSWCLEKTWLSSVCLSKMELWHRAVKPRYRICECCGPLQTQASCWVQDTCLQSDGEGNADPLCWESRLKHLYHVLLWRKLIERIHIFDFLPDKHKEPTVLKHLCVFAALFYLPCLNKTGECSGAFDRASSTGAGLLLRQENALEADMITLDAINIFFCSNVSTVYSISCL